MAFDNNADVKLGEEFFRLDYSYATQSLYRSPYEHYGQSAFTGRTDISGRPGEQNLLPDDLQWPITEFTGEGQTVWDQNTPARFFRSEGLNFRVPGQFTLNGSALATAIIDSAGASVTKEGAADFSSVTGSSTTSGTDRLITGTAGTEKIKSSSYTPGATRVQADFYLYTQGFTPTVLNGSSMHVTHGDGHSSGTTWVIPQGGAAGTANKATGTDFDADVQVQVDFHVATAFGVQLACSIWDTTGSTETLLKSSGVKTLPAQTIDLDISMVFVPKSGKTYQFRVSNQSTNGHTVIVNTVEFGQSPANTVATVEVYDETNAVSIQTQNVTLSGTAAGTIVASLVYTAPAATAYTFRVKNASSADRTVYIWTDKVIASISSVNSWTLDALELGLGGNVFVTGHRTGTDSNVWIYDIATDSWTKEQALSGQTNITTYALAHTDKYEYILMSDKTIWRTDNSSGATHTEAYTAATTGTAVGMCITQDRIVVLSEDSTNGVNVYCFGVDLAATAPLLASQQVTSSKNTADTTMRQRMCSSPTGARFFVNYSDVTCKIYQTDTSSTSLITTEIGDLGVGAKATAIAYEAGVTFIVGQYLAESDQTPRSALWIIDQNGLQQRIAYFRYTDPNANAPAYITPYQSDLYILQGPFLWRYSLEAGGLFLEYELQPQDATQARGMAVLQGRIWALYGDDGSGTNSSEVWVAGTQGTYRQAGADGSNQFVSSVYDFSLPGFVKDLIAVDVLTDDMPDDTSVSVEYQFDQDGTWTTLGTATEGTQTTFLAANAADPLQFNTVQVRVTPASTTGVNTPTVQAIVVRALPAAADEFFDLALLCMNQNGLDPEFRIAGEQTSGADKLEHVAGLWRSHAPVTFNDGFRATRGGETDDYLVRVDNFRQMMNKPGEGRALVTLRVIR